MSKIDRGPIWIRIHYLDASAAVKLLVKEEGSEILEEYMKEPDHSSNLFMTSFCVAETLSVLKRKFLREWSKEQPYKVAQEKYLAACNVFIGQLRGGMIDVHDIPIANRDTYSKVDARAKRYCLDVVDAFQLVTLEEGFVAPLRGTKSECILITADECLAKAAKAEKLWVWDCMREPAP
jgi:predicted nucleic acid-binding protein